MSINIAIVGLDSWSSFGGETFDFYNIYGFDKNKKNFN